VYAKRAPGAPASESLDLPGLGEPAAPQQDEPAEEAVDEPLEFNLGDLDSGVDSGSEPSPAAGGDEEGARQFPAVDVSPEKEESVFGTDSQAQFEKAFQELSAYVDTRTPPEGESAEAGPSDIGGEDLDLGGMDFGGEGDDDDMLDLGDDDGDDVSEVDTKIDLARAYIDMGDSDGAKSILEEVIEDGNDEQKKEARSLLDSI
jgi:pilus assembly protein FimV